MSDDQQFWIGLGAAAVLVVIGSALPKAFETGSTGKIILRALMFAIFLLAGVAVLWAIVQPRLSTAPASEGSGRPERLAAQLSQKEWALDGESCERGGIRLITEGDELVAYPRGAAAFRHRLVTANGQRLMTQLNGRTVVFEIRADGFTYVDRGFERWFRLCA